MSSAPTDESGAAAASRTPTAPPRPKRRRLRRWLVWLALIAIALRITLEFTLHHVVTYGIGLAGLAGECRGASLSLLGGAVRLRGVTLADPDAGKGERGMQLRVEEIAADVSTWQLLRGELVLTDAVLRDVDLRLHRRSDGAIELPDAWQGSGGAEPEPEPEPEAGGPPDFELPLSIVTARIDDLHVHLTEADPERPPLDLVVALDADDVGRRDVPGRLALRIGTPELPNRLVLDARIETPPHRLACSLSLSANGLDLARLLPAAAGIEPLSLTLAIGVEAGAAENEPDGRHLAIAAELQRAPGFARKFVARFDGTFHADGSSALRADLDADAVALRPLAALLRDAGVALAPDGVDLAAAATASLPANAEGPIALQLTGVRLAHGDDAVELGEMAIDGLRLGDAGCEVDSVRIVGPTAQVVKDLDGSLAIAGLTLLPTAASAPDAAPDAPTTPSTPATATAPGAPAAAPALPTVLVQSLDWRGTALSFADRSQAGSDPLEVRDLTLTGSGLACACDREPGTATLALSVPGIAETVTADLRLQPQQHGGMLEIEFVGDGITLARLQPWLAPAGIAPAFETARLAFGLHAEVGGEKAPEHLRARLADLRFTAGDTVLASLRNAELRELRLDRPKLAFDALDVLEPVVRLERSATATTVAGLRFGAATAEPAAGPAVAAPGPAARPAATDAPPLALATGPVTLRDATVHILDTDRGRSHSYGFDVELGAVRGAGRAAWAEPVPFALELRLEQQLRALSLRGSFARGAEDRVTLTAELAGRGIRGASLAPLLPAGARSPLSDGSVTANLEFAATAFARDFDATLRDLRLADGDQELAAIDLLQLRAPELGAERVHVSSLRAEGIRARVTATPDGLQVPGLLLGIAAPPPAGGAAGEATEAPAPAIAEAAARAAPAPASASLPQLQLDELVIAADDLTFRDRRGGDGEPIHTTLRLELATPWQTAAELQETPPLQFRLRGAATPLLANLEVDLTLQALANAPTLAVELTAAGIDTTALPRALPGLADTLAGTETAASLRASLHAELELARSDPTRFDALARPFGGTFTLEGLELLGTDGGELARVPAIDGELRAFDPASGDLLLRSLELDSPTLRAAQTPAGLEVAGLLLKAPPTPDAATAPSESPPAEPLPAEPPPTGAGTTGPEIAVDDLRVYGLAFDWRDATTTPPTLVPIEDLDLRVQRWSTRVLTEPRQFAFDLSVRGGQIPLPRRQDSSSVFAGIARATADLATGGSDEHEIEARPLLEELTLRGHLQVFPIAKGRIDLSVHAFELQALRGMAAPSGVEINDGVLDADIGLDLMAQGIALKSQETFTWLQISEPPSGPISTYLKLPAPLDLVLFALRNDNGEQRIPLQVWLPAREGAPTTRIAQAAIEALSLLISESVGSTPWRMVRTVTDALGISGREELDTEPAVLICAPGSATPDFAPLAALLERVGTGDELGFVLTHELGAADYARAEQLANPDRELAAETVARLAAERDALALRRARLAPEVAARLLAGQRPEASPRFAALRDLDAELAAVQQALDAATALFDGDGPRDRRRRTRRAALGLAEVRLAAVQADLLRRLGPDAASRIELRAARAVVADGLEAGGRVLVRPRARNRVVDRSTAPPQPKPKSLASPDLVPDQRL